SERPRIHASETMVGRPTRGLSIVERLALGEGYRCARAREAGLGRPRVRRRARTFERKLDSTVTLCVGFGERPYGDPDLTRQGRHLPPRARVPPAAGALTRPGGGPHMTATRTPLMPRW